MQISSSFHLQDYDELICINHYDTYQTKLSIPSSTKLRKNT